MANRIIFGTVLTLALNLSPHLAQAITPKSLSSIGEDTSALGLTAIYLETNSKERFFRSSGAFAGNLPDRVLRQARCYLDTPYRWGGSLQTGRATDCSGFVQYIYKKSNINLPRASAEQAQVGTVAARKMDFSKLLAGDLLFFRRGGRHIGHVGIYAGDGKMIHASSERRGVTITDLRQSYYQDTFVVAKRLPAAQQSH